MNVFEDLIEELRDENLLEQTITELTRSSAKTAASRVASQSDLALETQSPTQSSNGGASVSERASADEESGEEEEGDFYRKRAIDEVSSLHMVEHVLSGIEREYMKMVPASYNDLAVKKALHTFLQVQVDPSTTEYADAEFQLMHETEAWNSVLAERDHKISVANVRRFCENSRPVLSSQALLSLARFYRNAPFSEATRSKFDFVMTRLFARENDGAKRRLLFGRAQMIGHIKTLYANWSSLALYAADDASLKSRSIVAGLEDRIAEAESALTFDQLIQNNFFKKVHGFKEASGEIFFTPEVVAAAIECNTKIGNKFLDLIRLERERTSASTVEEKYGSEHDQLISAAAGKTLHLAEVVKNLPESDAPKGENFEPTAAGAQEQVVIPARAASKTPRKPFLTFNIFGVNKWLLLATIATVLASSGLYFWSDQSISESSATESAKDINLESSGLNEYMRSGRATSETFYAITLPTWDELAEEKKKEVLRQALAFANQNGQRNVQLVNLRGRSVGFASKKRLEILNP